uniref:Uncharacterized protein n=1 Tax=Phytophthora ramorum TaxID=164328 RepID=H3HBN6_PHYRM
LAISMDANFRTFVVAVRSNALVLIALMVIGALVFLQVIDADHTRVHTEIPVPCLLPAALAQSFLGVEIGNNRTHVLHKQLGISAPEMSAASGAGKSSTAHAIPVVGFLFTMVFCTVFACASQRDMLRALLFHNFGFLFSMVHCSVASLCVADMLSWDYRCWAVASTFLWFVWVQLLDAVTPPVRRMLTFSNLQVVPVLLLLILLNRLFIMFFWMQRHAWNVFKGAFMRCWRSIRPPIAPETPSEGDVDPEEEELAAMRGSLEYFSP